MKNNVNAHGGIIARIIKAYTASCLAIVMVASGLNSNLLTIKASDDSAEH
jgi:hypothetical protein